MNSKNFWFDDFMQVAGAAVLYWILVVAIGQFFL